MSHYDLAICIVCGGIYIASIASLHALHVVTSAECGGDCSTCASGRVRAETRAIDERGQ